MKRSLFLAAAACGLFTAPAMGQSLMRRPANQPVVNAAGEVDRNAGLRNYSLMLVEPPRPKSFEVHDKITIIISETSRQSSSSTLDTKKDTDLKAELNQFPDLGALLNGVLTTGDSSPVVGVDVSSGRSFKGDGKYERSDRFTDRVTATIIDVKPNGVLVVEARRTIQKDKEIQELVLSGECRREDVTGENTVLSSQLADLTLRMMNEGDLKNAASKGFITRFFESIFNF